MSVNISNSILIVSDIEGFISLWDIKHYCIDKTSTSTPKCNII